MGKPPGKKSFGSFKNGSIKTDVTETKCKSTENSYGTEQGQRKGFANN